MVFTPASTTANTVGGLKMDVNEAINEIRKQPKRNFTQTFDLIIALKNIDMKKPENNINIEVRLPYPPKENRKIAIFSDQIKNGISKKELEKIANDKKQAKSFCNQYDFFVSEPTLMPIIGKLLGKYLGPRRKMPKVIPPNANMDKVLENIKKTVIIRARTSNIQVSVGKENMDNDKIRENVKRVIEEVEKTLPKGRSQIKAVYLKLTMSKPVKIDKW